MVEDTVAGVVPLDAVLERLRTTRPVFHSEADFQHHVAWELHQLAPTLQVRLETRPDPALREQVDILVEDRATSVGTVIELKFLKAAWEGAVNGERFKLPNTGAHDIVRYDVVKDVARVERFVAPRPRWNGFVLVLTNDSMHWRTPLHERATIAEAFRIHDGAELRGDRAWDARAGGGTTRGRELPLSLAGRYRLSWEPYSRLDGRNGEFRLLRVAIPGDVTPPGQ